MLDPDPQIALSVAEKCIQRFVIAALERDGHDTEALLDSVADTLGHARAVAILMVMGRYTTHAIMVNSLGIKAPVPSIFEDGFVA